MSNLLQSIFNRAAWHTWASNTLAAVPQFVWTWKWIYVGVIGTCALIGIVLLFLRRLHPGIRERLSTFCWTNVLLGLFLFFCRTQQIPYVGSDMLRFLQEVGMVVWLGFILHYALRTRPKEKLHETAKERFNKYLPQAKS